MNRYTIYCTPEQTKKALELGAPIETFGLDSIAREMIECAKECDEIASTEEWLNSQNATIYRDSCYSCPTAEQMIGWLEDGLLEEVHIEQDIDGLWSYTIYRNGNDLFGISNLYPTRKEATLAAIDAALEYIENLKQ